MCPRVFHSSFSILVLLEEPTFLPLASFALTLKVEAVFEGQSITVSHIFTSWWITPTPVALSQSAFLSVLGLLSSQKSSVCIIASMFPNLSRTLFLTLKFDLQFFSCLFQNPDSSRSFVSPSQGFAHLASPSQSVHRSSYTCSDHLCIRCLLLHPLLRTGTSSSLACTLLPQLYYSKRVQKILFPSQKPQRSLTAPISNYISLYSPPMWHSLCEIQPTHSLNMIVFYCDEQKNVPRRLPNV